MGRRVAITGAAGQLGRQLVQTFTEAGDDVLALTRPEFDITDASDLGRLTGWGPDVVVNSAAWTDVDGCARDPDRAMRINGEAAGAVARAAANAGALIVHVSTNEVFDGTLHRPYTEEDEPNPINPYGASKLAGERAVAAMSPRHLIVRTAWLFGPDGTNFVTKILAASERARAAGEPLRVVDDEWGNPTWTPWLAGAVVDAVRQVESGRVAVDALHLAGQPPVSRRGWAGELLRGRDIAVLAITGAEFPRPSRVPQRALLDTSRAESLGISTPDWRLPSQRLAATLVS